MAKEGFGSHLVVVFGGNGDAGTEEKFFLLKHLHREQRPLEHTVATSVVGSFQFSFKTDDRHHVEVVFEELRIGRPDECAIGEDRKNDVLHFGCTFQQVAAHQRFTSSQ